MIQGQFTQPNKMQEVTIEDLGQQIGDFLLAQLRGELKSQGHILTGKLSKTMAFKMKVSNSLKLEFIMQDYGIALSEGVKPGRIPYKPRRKGEQPRGGTSKYIQGLINFAKKKFGYSRQRAEAVAFAIGSTQARKGLTGSRWIDISIESSKEQIEKFISIWTIAQINQLLKEVFNE